MVVSLIFVRALVWVKGYLEIRFLQTGVGSLRYMELCKHTLWCDCVGLLHSVIHSRTSMFNDFNFFHRDLRDHAAKDDSFNL